MKKVYVLSLSTILSIVLLIAVLFLQLPLLMNFVLGVSIGYITRSFYEKLTLKRNK